MTMSAALLLPWFEVFLLVALLQLLLFLLLKIRRQRAVSSNSRLPPSPPKLPIIGNLHQLGSLPHLSLCALSKKHGPLMLLQLGGIPTLVVSSADAAREIMRTHDLIFATRPSLKVARILLFQTPGLAFSPYGEYWRQLRKLCVTHLFSTKMVQSFRLMREEEATLMIEHISSLASSSMGVVDMSKVLHSFSNDLVCRVVSGKFFCEEGRNDTFRELIEENMLLLAAFHVEDFLPSLAWLDVFFGLTARAKRNAKRWGVVLDALIKDHDDRSEHNRPRSEDFTHTLLSLQKDPNMEVNLTKKQIKALLMDMFAAGTDTSYVVLEWAMAELVRNPEAMKKLRDEVRGIVGGTARVREEDLNEMSYLKAVLKESLRLHPPAPLLLPRESMDDCRIHGYEVPKQARVIINAWAIGRDPKYWEAPDEFHPERFMGSSVDFKGNDFQFIPFGSGRRICPGMNFAVSTTELALANLIHHFDWELPRGMLRENLDMTEAPGLTTRRKHRLHLLVKPCSY